MDYTNLEEIRGSKFNGGMLAVYRMGKLQDRINDCSIAPLGIHPILGIRNYEVWLSSLNSLVSEIIGKLGDDEKKKVLEMRDTIEVALSKLPIFKTTTSQEFGSVPQEKFLEKNWIMHRQAIRIYNKEIMLLIEKYKLNNPANDDDDGL